MLDPKIKPEINFLINDKRVTDKEKYTLDLQLRNEQPKVINLSADKILEGINDRLAREKGLEPESDGTLNLSNCGLTRISIFLQNHVIENSHKIKILNLEGNYLTIMPMEFLDSINAQINISLENNYLHGEELTWIYNVVIKTQHLLDTKYAIQEQEIFGGRNFTPQANARRRKALTNGLPTHRPINNENKTAMIHRSFTDEELTNWLATEKPPKKEEKTSMRHNKSALF